MFCENASKIVIVRSTIFFCSSGLRSVDAIVVGNVSQHGNVSRFNCKCEESK